ASTTPRQARVPRFNTACATASASMTRAPSCSRILHTVLLPVAILPVRPIIYILRNAADTESPPVGSWCREVRLPVQVCLPCLSVPYWVEDYPDILSSAHILGQSFLLCAKNLGDPHPIKYHQTKHNATLRFGHQSPAECRARLVDRFARRWHEVQSR